MSNESRRQLLEQSGLVHPHPESVTAPLFQAGSGFFFSLDKLQVKYEMLRSHVVEGSTVTAAASLHGYSRAEFYLVASSFEEGGMTGLLDERRGRKGPVKLTREVLALLDSLGPCSASVAASAIESELGVRLHERSIQRARKR